MPKNSKSYEMLPQRLEKLMKETGSDLKEARRRRKISVRDMAKRVGVSPATVIRLEKGDAAVGLGIFMTVLFILGLDQKLVGIFSLEKDLVGQQLAGEDLPKRIRRKKSLNNLDF